MSAEVRPNVKMSQEEHGAMTELTANVRVLASGFSELKGLVGDLARNTDARFNAMSERGRFSRGDLFGLLGALAAMGGIIASFLSMRIDNALAPVQTQNQVSIVDRASLHEEVADIRKAITAGRSERLADKQEHAVLEAVLIERGNEDYYERHGHYPAPIR